MADRIEVDYAQLEKLGGLLVQRAETIENQMNRLRQSMEALRNSWKGEASEDFFAEFEDRAMPSMRRLYDVLSRTGQTLKHVSETYRQAEEQAGNLFRGGGMGGGIGVGMGVGGTGSMGDGSVMPGESAVGGASFGGGGTGSMGDGSVMPGESVVGGASFGGGGTGNFGSGGTGGFGGGSTGGFGGGSTGGFGGGSTGGFGGGGTSSFASDQLNFKGGAVVNGFNTIRDATNALNAPAISGNLDPLSGKVLGKGAMLGGVGGIGDFGNMKDFFKDFFNTNQAQLQDLVNTTQNALSAALQAINAFADLVDTLF